MKKILLKANLALLCVFAFSFMQGQENGSVKATNVGTATSMITIPSISSRTVLEPAIIIDKEMNDGRTSKNEVIIGKDSQVEDDYYFRNPHPMAQRLKGKAPSLVFDAVASSSMPTDPALAVSENHVFMVFNTGFRIYDKEGNPLTAQLSPASIFGSVGCCDLTVSYDNAADRWIVSMLYTGGGGAKLAISSSGNPLESEWNVYSFTQVNDYQKVSVWSDGYYMTDNTSASNKVYVFERDKMIQGDPNARIVSLPLPGLRRRGFYSPQAFNVTGNNLPAPGNVPIVFLQDDAWAGVSQDHVKLWLANVDWENPTNSTMSAPIEITTTPFISVFDGGSFSNLTQPQPGGGRPLDAIQSTIMNQAQFRKFPTHNSAIFNFVINVGASSGKRAGIRWYELRQDGDGQPWSVYQEGTYTSPDGKHAWMGSMVMDKFGNIGMGYTGMGTTEEQRVSSYYTGRYANDPINTMTIQEELIAAGNANIPGYRYGDYAKIDIDPSDDKTFWFTNEYMNNGRKNVVGAFQIAPNFQNDLGVISIDSPTTGALSNSEIIKVSVYNYGMKAQSNFPIKLMVDGVEVASEMFTGSLASLGTATYTFTTGADLSTEGKTYSISVSTTLAGDEDNTNNTTTKEVTHLYKKDLGVTSIKTPVSGGNLGNETITAVIKNYGSQPQSNFTMSYSINGGEMVSETVTGDVQPNGGELDYEFQTKGNFSEYQEYTIKVQVSLEGDQVNTNDSAETTVVNSACDNELNDTATPFGTAGNNPVESVITINNNVKITDLNVKVNIQHTYVKDIIMSLIAPDGTEVILAKENGGSGHNFTNTVFDDDASTSIAAGKAPFTGSFKPIGKLSNFNGMNPTGDWKLKLVDTYLAADSGKLINWSIDYCHESMSTTDVEYIKTGNLLIVDKGNDQFTITLPNSEVKSKKVDLDVYNYAGQQLLNRRLKNDGSDFSYDLNMSYAAPGVYIITMSNGSYKATGKIIVK